MVLHSYMPTCQHSRHYMHTLPSRFALMKSDDLTVRCCSNVLMYTYVCSAALQQCIDVKNATPLEQTGFTYIHAYMQIETYIHAYMHNVSGIFRFERVLRRNEV